MEKTQAKITSFTQLNVWKQGHEIVLTTYRLTRKFPIEERYCLTDQMRRAAISITSNIAEGFGRKNFKEKIQFYYLAEGSATELQNQFIVCKDVNYISDVEFASTIEKLDSTQRLLSGLISKTKSFANSTNRGFI